MTQESESQNGGKKFTKVGCVGRWKPLHLGGEALLEALCEQAEHVVIGIGSCNKYNARNPFTADESKEMIDAVLSPRFSNYEIVFVPDFAQNPEYRDGKKWKNFIQEHPSFKPIDLFISGNDYVAELVQDKFHVQKSFELVAEEKRIPIKSSMVRLEMARGDGWKKYVSPIVANYLESRGLVDRFRNEFGLEVLAGLTSQDYYKIETRMEERKHTYEK